MPTSETTNWVTFILIVVALIVAVVLLVYCIPSSANAGESVNAKEMYTSYNPDDGGNDETGFDNSNGAMFAPDGPSNADDSVATGVSASEPLGENEIAYPLDYNPSAPNAGGKSSCFPKDQLTPLELLPGDANSTWAQVVPAGQGSVGDQNFLNAGFHVGINTVGQTLRNPNLQLRSEPANPQVKVSPWLQSTIEPDTNRKALEIGGC